MVRPETLAWKNPCTIWWDHRIAKTDTSGTLNSILAKELELSLTTLDCHWNVVGELFGPLHGLFGDQYDELTEFADGVAERARQLGGRASIGTLTSNAPKSAEDMLQYLLSGHEDIMQAIRRAIKSIEKAGDSGTANFLTDLMEKHEKMAWMLRSSLE